MDRQAGCKTWKNRQAARYMKTRSKIDRQTDSKTMDRQMDCKTYGKTDRLLDTKGR